MTLGQQIEVTSKEVESECQRACALWPSMHSAHEGYAVILEELEELKEHVWMNQKKRELLPMRKEAIQLAAMAMRFCVDICNGESFQK